MKANLITGSTDVLADVLARACQLGAADEVAGERQKTGKQLCELFAVDWRIGHAKILRSAYRAGRWHRALKDHP